jgi:hypothetical protein
MEKVLYGSFSFIFHKRKEKKMKLTKLQAVSMFLSAAGLVMGWIQTLVDGKITEDYVREEVDRIMEEREQQK